jgi:hypothetical protein
MSRIEIRPYNGDLDALRTLAYTSWTAEYAGHTGSSWPDLYTPALSRYYFESGQDRRLLVGAYLDGEMVGFLANLPRQYRFRGRHYKGVISGLLAVRPDVPAAVGLMLANCMQGNLEYGADLALFTLEKNHKTIRLARTLRTNQGQTSRLTTRLVRMHPLVHAIDLPTIQEHEGLGGLITLAGKCWGADRPIVPGHTPGEIRPCQPGDLPGVLALTEQVSDQDQLVRVYDLPSLERRFNSGVLSTQLGGMVVYERQGEISGFISFSTYNMVTMRGTHPWAWIDLVYWEGCSLQEKHNLIAGVWALCRERGCIGVLVWTKQRISHFAFFRTGFFPYSRPMDLQVGILNPSISLQGVKGVFEQMM